MVIKALQTERIKAEFVSIMRHLPDGILISKNTKNSFESTKVDLRFKNTEIEKLLGMVAV